MRRSGAVTSVLLGLLGVLGCEPEARQTETQVMLRVENTDADLLARMTHLRATASLRLPNGWRAPVEQLIPVSRLHWPVEIPIIPKDAAESKATFEVVVEALASGQVLAQTRTVSSFLSSEYRLLSLRLFTCQGDSALVVCAEPDCHGEECTVCNSAGACVPTGYTSPSSLSSTGSRDAGEIVGLDNHGGSSEDAGLVSGAVGMTDAGSAFDATTAMNNAGPMTRDATVSASCAVLNCAANSHCVESGEPHCVCDSGFNGEADACRNIDDCDSKHCVAPIAQIEAGSYHTCAVRTDGTVLCWGSTELGSTMPGIAGAAQVAGGDGYSCARVMNGEVKCWGRNDQGQLGDGSSTSSALAIAVPNISGAVDLAAGSDSTCVALTDSAKCWGWNASGQLGNGTRTNSSTPVTVTGLTNAIEVAVRESQACARSSAGSVWCWGFNNTGALGNGTTDSSYTPVQVSNLTTAVQIAVGADHACARLANTSVVCWGDGSAGQTGSGAGSSTPMPVPGLATVTDIAAGFRHTCAVRSDGRVLCWGLNDQGQLGIGSTSNAAVPTLVSGLTNATDVTCGTQHSCALLSDGSVKCWGYNMASQLGNISDTRSLVPVSVTFH